MSVRKVTKVYLVVAIGVTVLIANQFSTNPNDYVRAPRNLSTGDKSFVENRVKSRSSPGSIAAVINTAKMGTGGLFKTFAESWNCPSAPPVQYLSVDHCEDHRRYFRTHTFDAGSGDIQKHRNEHPGGQCLIATAIRSPASWFGSMYLQMAKNNWKPKEEMLKDYRAYLAAGDFHMLDLVLPDLLKEFNAGTLVDQMKLMDVNGGYTLTPAPETSVLAGCDLLFLRLEQSDRWPEIFEMLDPRIENKKGVSRMQRHPDNIDQITAISTYELTSEERINIYNSKNKFIQEWFDAYGYMDGAANKGSNGKLTAVINTPKMGTGGLFLTLTENQGCHESGPPVKGLSMLKCENDHKALRTHLFDVGSNAILEHRKEDPDGQCLIVTAIRSPRTWFASKFLQQLGGCNRDEWPTKEELLTRFKDFTQRLSSYKALHGALPELLNEFHGGSLVEQFKIMNENGGYSMLGPAPEDSVVAGCKLLFLRMEQSEQWPSIFKKIDPTIEFQKGESRVDQCPEFSEYIKVVADYEMSVQERKNIYIKGGAFVREWFDSYNYVTVATEDDIAYA